MNRENIDLGDRVKDIITGFEGIVTGKCQYITGCDQVLVQPRVKDDGSKAEGGWFDSDRCTVINAGAIDPLTVRSVERPGSDDPAPIK